MTEDCARGIVQLKLTTDRHESSRGLSATAGLLVCPCLTIWCSSVSVYTIFVAIGVVQFQCNHGRPGQEGAPAVPWKMYNAIDSLQFQHFGSYKKKKQNRCHKTRFASSKLRLLPGLCLRPHWCP